MRPKNYWINNSILWGKISKDKRNIMCVWVNCVQVVVDSMVSLCRELCPMSCSAAERLSPPLSSISEQVSIPRSAIRSALMERAAEDINRALE